MKRFAAFVGLTLLLGGCGLLPKSLTPDTPEEALIAAKGTYAGTLHLIKGAAKAGKLNDNIILDRLEPARQAAKAAIELAEELLDLNDPNAMDYIEAALQKARDFRGLYQAIAGPQARIDPCPCPSLA